MRPVIRVRLWLPNFHYAAAAFAFPDCAALEEKTQQDTKTNLFNSAGRERSRKMGQADGGIVEMPVEAVRRRARCKIYAL